MSQETAHFFGEDLIPGGLAGPELAATVANSAGRLLLRPELPGVIIATEPVAEVIADSAPNAAPTVSWEEIVGAFDKAKGVLRKKLLASDEDLRFAWAQASIRAERDGRPADDELYWDTVSAFMDANGIGQRDRASDEAKTPLTFRAIRILAETQPYFFAEQRIQAGVAPMESYEAIDRYTGLLRAFVEDYPAVDSTKLAAMLADSAKGLLGSEIVSESSAGALRTLLDDMVISVRGRTENVVQGAAEVVQKPDRNQVTALEISQALQQAQLPLFGLRSDADFLDLCAERCISVRNSVQTAAFWEAYADLINDGMVTEQRRSRGDRRDTLYRDAVGLLARVPAFIIAEHARSSSTPDPGFHHNSTASVIGTFRRQLRGFAMSFPNASPDTVAESMGSVAKSTLQGRVLLEHALEALPAVVQETQQLTGFYRLVEILAAEGEPWGISFPSTEAIDGGADYDCIIVARNKAVAVDLAYRRQHVDARHPREHRSRTGAIPRITIQLPLLPEDFAHTFSISDEVARARAPAARQIIDRELARTA